MNTSEFVAKLRLMRAMLAKGWMKHALAHDRNGRYVKCDSPDAVRWCVLGAALGVGLTQYETRIELPGGKDGDWSDMVQWNNHPKRTKADMLACIDNSIAALQGTNPRECT